MKENTNFFNGYSFAPYVSFVLRREEFTKWKVDKRNIEDHELVLVTKGSGRLITDEQEFLCEKGSLLYLHEGMRHSIVADADSPITFFSIHFSYLKVNHSAESWVYYADINYYKKKKPNREETWVVDTKYAKLPFENVQTLRHYNEIKDIFFKMNYIYSSKNPGFELQLNSLLLELLYILFRENITLGDSRINQKKLSLAQEYIEENLKKHISLSDLTSLLGVSESSLNKLFKKNTGKTPMQYINQVRINHAGDLLLNTDMTVKEISYYMGFCDEYYFSRIFKKITNLSPGLFRNQI